MCGIAGAYQQADGEPVARRLADRLAHRGPDGHGHYGFADDRVQVNLTHRRLAIIDPAHGQQPLRRGGLAVSYNGELYNFRELRRELQAGGAAFATDCDTEVVLEAWHRWGPACLGRFRGMFALAVFDERTGSLFLARDQLGIKPLHYFPRKDGVVFASELKALVGTVGDGLAIDAGAMVASMLFYWVPDSRCAVRGVHKLPSGTWAEFRPDGSHRVVRYWDIAEVAAAAAGGDPIGPLDLAATIEASVEAHLVADVPVSTFLSGGLDSSIVSVLAKRFKDEVDAYTITFRPEDNALEAMPDDAVYARRVARRYGITLHEMEIAPDVVDLLPRVVAMLDEPVGDPAAINTYLMCASARSAGVKVVLSGMGADELFGGYRKHLACTLAARYRTLPGPARRLTAGVVDRVPVKIGGRGLRHVRWAKRFLSFSDLPEEAAFRRSYSLYDPPELSGLIAPELAPAVDEVVGEHLAVYDDNTLPDHVNRMCLADSRLFLPGLNLAYTDRASMAASTEIRVPFVDPVVFRAAFALPGDDKVRGRSGKVALKRAARTWLPDEIIDRPKGSFSAPLRAWVGRDLKELVDDVLVRGELVGCGFLRERAVGDLVAADRAGREDRSKQVWQLLTLELWYRRARADGLVL